MAVLRCTKKLLKELKTVGSAGVHPAGPLGGWHANLLRIDRRKCVLFTQNATLFSFLVPGLKKPHYENFLEVFRQSLFKRLLHEEIPQRQIEAILDEHREIVIAKTNNRSVLGSMNDLAFQLRYQIVAQGGLENVDLYELNRYLNRIPMGAINAIYSIDELKALLSKVDG
jgi:hypothetical protein